MSRLVWIVALCTVLGVFLLLDLRQHSLTMLSAVDVSYEPPAGGFAKNNTLPLLVRRADLNSTTLDVSSFVPLLLAAPSFFLSSLFTLSEPTLSSAFSSSQESSRLSSAAPSSSNRVLLLPLTSSDEPLLLSDESSSLSRTLSAPSSSAQVTVVSTTQNGSTFVVTQTTMVTSSAEPSLSLSEDTLSLSGGLSDTNKIIVGVVVGVGGAALLGFAAIIFYVKRRNSRGQESGWTFWRKNEKGHNDDFFSGELGVRDRDINQGLNF